MVLTLRADQIKQVFRRFSTAEPEFPWTILGDTVATLQVLLDRAERALGDDSQSENARASDGANVDDSIMVLSSPPFPSLELV